MNKITLRSFRAKSRNLFSVFLFLSASLVSNLSYTDEPIHKNDTNNVSHQFYDACVQTPVEGLGNLASATKDAAQAVAHSDAPQKLKEAGKQLVVNAPVKLAYAVKNGAVKACDTTKDVTQQVINSEFVQEGKEVITEIGEQLLEAGQYVYDATAQGAHTAYHVMIEKPTHAITNYINESLVEKNPENTVGVVVVQKPICSVQNRCFIETRDDVNALHKELVEPCTLEVTQANNESQVNPVTLEFAVATPCTLTLDTNPLSEDTLEKINIAYQAVQNDLAQS